MDASAWRSSPSKSLADVMDLSSVPVDIIGPLHQHRAILMERETSLQRWAVALELEANRMASTSKVIKQQEEQVSHEPDITRVKNNEE